VFRRRLGEVDHPLGREDVRSVIAEGHALARTAAFRMDEKLCVGCLALPSLDVVGADTGMDVALPEPDGELAPRDALEPDPEKHVREKQDLAVGRNRLD